MHAIVEETPTGVTVLSPSGEVLYCGMDRDEVIQQLVRDTGKSRLTGKDRASIDTAIDLLRKSEEILQRLMRDDGVSCSLSREHRDVIRKMLGGES